MYQTVFLGKTLITDNERLFKILQHTGVHSTEKEGRALETEFPGLVDTVVRCLRELEQKQAPTDLVLYVNWRVQVWAGQQFDIQPSAVVLCVPPGTSMDPNGDSQQK